MTRQDRQNWVTRILVDVAASGFCLPPAEGARLEAAPPTNIDAFTDAIITAEGLDPTLIPTDLRQGVRAAVARHFQGHVVEEIAEDIGPLLDELAMLLVTTTASRYDPAHSGNYYVDFDARGVEFRITRDRGQYLIDAHVDQLKALGLFRVINSREELREAVLRYVKAVIGR